LPLLPSAASGAVGKLKPRVSASTHKTFILAIDKFLSEKTIHNREIINAIWVPSEKRHFGRSHEQQCRLFPIAEKLSSFASRFCKESPRRRGFAFAK
jgi:hypothetical protein